jgi:hypothetical protein
LEYALAKADFLNAPDLALVQAFAIFLFLVRRHDSPRFVWMMTGLVIRMAQALGLQRDGSNFDHFSPYEIEIRRRVWWAVCLLDLRASEDQGMELTITNGSFDTKLPLNINNADIDPQMENLPLECDGLTDTTLALVSYDLCDIMRRMMASPNPEDQRRLLNEIYENVDRSYLQLSTESQNILYGAVICTTRLVMAKMTLIIYLPILFSSPSEQLSDEIRTKLLVSAIEVAEYNHTLNSETKWRQLRWIFQTYSHWHAIVFLLIETARRPWSPIVERAWVALHSSWLIPVQSKTDKNMRIWFPLRKLMAKARKHRDEELDRLRGDVQATEHLEIEDSHFPLPTSSGPFTAGESDVLFRERWRKLIVIPREERLRSQLHVTPAMEDIAPSIAVNAESTTLQDGSYVPVLGESELWSDSNNEPIYLAGQDLSTTSTTLDHPVINNPRGEVPLGQFEDYSYNGLPTVPLDWSGGRSIGSGLVPWLWADVDPSADVFSELDVNMDLDTEVDWYSWVQTAKSMD